MIVYKVNEKPQVEANAEIREMGAVLAEIPTTLRILQNLLKQHEESIATPSLTEFRQEILNMIPEALRLTHLISVHSQRLSVVSDQLTKQLSTLDNNVRTALVTKSARTEPTQQAEGSTQDSRNSQSFRIFQRQA